MQTLINKISILTNTCCVTRYEYDEFNKTQALRDELQSKIIERTINKKEYKKIIASLKEIEPIIKKHNHLKYFDKSFNNLLLCDMYIKELHESRAKELTTAPKNKSVIDHEQQNFIIASLEHSKLFGIPGGGKTKSIIDKIIHLKQTEKYGPNNFMIVTFSRNACNDFLEKGNKSCNKLFTNQNVNSLAGTIMFTLRKKKTSCLHTIILSATKYINEKCRNGELLRIKCLANCKLIVVDESQDISENQYAFIMTISDILKIPVIMVGDPNQNIYQFQNGSDKFLLEHPGPQISYINNYRSTVQIVNFVNQMRIHKELPCMISAKDTHGKKPYIHVGNDNDIMKHIITEIFSSKYAFEEIAIIGPIKKSNENRNVGLNTIANILKNYKIPFCEHYSQGKDSSFDNQKKSIRKGHVNLYTIHGSKGLEFKKVLVVNAHFATMGRKPTMSEYHEFRYLWYVAFSRAIDELTIYVRDDKDPYPELTLCDTNMYTTNNSKKLQKFDYESKFEPDQKQLKYPIKDTINDKKYFTENALLEFEEKSKYKLNESIMFTQPNDVTVKNKHATLYGEYMENIFQFYYCSTHSKIKCFTDSIKNFFKSLIILAPKYHVAYYILKKSGCANMLNFDMLHQIKDKIDFDSYTYISEKMIDKSMHYNCVLQSSTQEYPKETIYRYCKKLKQNVDSETNNKIVYKISLIMHCINNETKFMLDKEHKINELDGHIKKIRKYIKTLPTGYKFQKICEHPNIPLIGEYDILAAKNKVIELKFVKNVGILHVLQTLMYYNNLFPNWGQEMKIEIWNLYTGKKYKITMTKKYTNFDFLKYICDALKIKMVNNVFVYDLETDGTEFANPQIIERHFQELYLDFVPSSGLIKIDKILGSFITKLTGITNKMMEKGDKPAKLKYDMDMIYKYCQKPIFVAHNGNSFDHRIMLQKKLLSEELTGKFLDSKSLISMIYDDDNLQKKKLCEIYEIVTGKDLTNVLKTSNAHRAEFDVMLLVGIFKVLKLKLCHFV